MRSAVASATTTASNARGFFRNPRKATDIPPNWPNHTPGAANADAQVLGHPGNSAGSVLQDGGCVLRLRRRDPGDELVRQARLGVDHMHHGVDQRQVGKRLREIAEVPAAARVDLLGIELQRAGVRKQLLAQDPPAVELADLAQRRNKPERADREGAFLAAQSIVGLGWTV